MTPEIEIFEVIRDRIEANLDDSLSAVKSVRVGYSEEARTGASLPFISISPSQTEDNEVDLQSSHYQIKESVPVEIRLVCNKLADKKNRLYNTTSRTGPLFLFAALKDTIEKNVLGDVGLGFSGKSVSIQKYSTSIEQGDDIVEFRLSLTLKTHNFTAGGRGDHESVYKMKNVFEEIERYGSSAAILGAPQVYITLTDSDGVFTLPSIRHTDGTPDTDKDGWVIEVKRLDSTLYACTVAGAVSASLLDDSEIVEMEPQRSVKFKAYNGNWTLH